MRTGRQGPGCPDARCCRGCPRGALGQARAPPPREAGAAAASQEGSARPTPGYRPGVPPPGGRPGPGPGPARYLQQVQLGREAPRHMEEAVVCVAEGHGHDRSTFPRTHQTSAAPHRHPARSPGRPPSLTWATPAGPGHRSWITSIGPAPFPWQPVGEGQASRLPLFWLLRRAAWGRHLVHRIPVCRKRWPTLSILQRIPARLDPSLSLIG